MANQTLRELAKEYAQGNLDKETYRKSRAELIQGIIAGTILLQPIEYPPLVQPPEPESLDATERKDDLRKPAAKKTGSEPPPSSPNTDTAGLSDHSVAMTNAKSNKMLFMGLAAVVFVVIILSVFALKGGSPSQSKSNPSTVAGTNEAESLATEQTKTQAEGLIRDFLNKNNWSNSSLNNFLQQWLELPAGDILSSKDSLEMGQLTNAIYKQLLEEQALSGLVDDDSSLNRQRQLVEFAAGLGIDDPRISLPEDAQAADEMMPP